MSAFRVLCLLSLLPLAGCSQTPPSNNTVPKASSAESAAIISFEKKGAVVKRDQHGSATDLDLHQLTLSPETLMMLAELKSLRVLNLAEAAFSDPSLAFLDFVSPQLVNLDLRGCEISNKATAPIARFTGLRALRFSGKNGKTSIDDEGLKNLAACKQLKVLALDDLWIGTEALKSLADLKELEELYLAGTVVDDESANVISRFPKLKKLRLARTQIGDASLETLSSCSTLEELDLSENSLITNSGMAHLAKLTNLRKLNLWRVQISDDGVLLLAPLTKLDWLNLDNTKLSDPGLSTLKNMNALTFLHLGSTQITAAGAPALFHLKFLKDLKLTRTALGADNAAVAELQKNLPDTTIQTEYVEKE